jgi:hypothetical protein
MLIVKDFKERLFSEQLLLLFLKSSQNIRVYKNGLNDTRRGFYNPFFFQFISSNNQAALLVLSFSIFCSFR